MNLPTLLNIAIALIFVYLIVSLLASQIQEFIATILQWRAVHVKESIEGLLSGNSAQPDELKKVRTLANEIYKNPIIKDLTFEARRGIASLVRAFSRFFSRYWFFEGVFGQSNSRPAYIAKEDFAVSLFETLQVSNLTKILIKLKLNYLISVTQGWKNFIPDPIFKDGKYLLYSDFDNGKIKLEDVIDGLNKITSLTLPFDSAKLTPGLLDIVQIIIIFNKLDIFNHRKNLKLEEGLELEIDKYLSDEFSGNKLIKYEFLSVSIKQYLISYAQKTVDEETEEVFTVICSLPRLPDPLINSLSDIARRSQEKVEKLEDQLSQFQKDVEDWFDKSMDRASGVYKRNAKLIAFLLGLTIAIAGNIDSIHMVDRIAKDQALQSSLNRAADNIVKGNNKLDDKTIKEINAEAEKISLPVGWGESEVLQQQNRSIKLLDIIPISSLSITLFGWIISAIAISMGSSFWFDLLGKLINVKDIGKIPNPNSSSRSSSSNSSSGSSSSSSSNSSS
jgi:hypothetical protein